MPVHSQMQVLLVCREAKAQDLDPGGPLRSWVPYTTTSTEKYDVISLFNLLPKEMVLIP